MDDCRRNGLNPYCPDINSCPIPDECNGAITFGACYRYWRPQQEDNVACLDSKVCNWRSSYYHPCTIDTPDCVPTCVNASLSSHVCLDCSTTVNGACLEIQSITDSNRCNLGLCTVDSTITDQTACESTGICSVSCPTCFDAAGCQLAGSCSDLEEFLGLAGETGVCIYPSTYDRLNGVYCDGENDILSKSGCASITVHDINDCQALENSVWRNFATSAQECQNNFGCGCYHSQSEIWLPKNESECLLDHQALWEPYYTWSNGTWTSGKIQKLVWEPRKYYTATQVQKNISYRMLLDEFTAAAAQVYAPAYQTEALCRYGTTNPLMKSAACDCGGSASPGESCFSETQKSDVLTSTGTACPYLESYVTSVNSKVTTFADSIPALSPCQTVSLYHTPDSQYRLPTTETISQSLYRGSTTNDYWVVQNENEQKIGQILSGAARVQYDFKATRSLELCINLDTHIKVAAVAEVFAIASLNSNKHVIVETTQVNLIVLPTGLSTLCANISTIGTYFAAKVVKDYTTFDNRVASIQYQVGAAIYAAVIVFAIIQTILLTLNKDRQKIFHLKITFIVFITINCIVRLVYVLLPVNAFKSGLDSIQFIIFELPTFLLFSVFTAIAYLWLVVVLKTYYVGRRGVVRTREGQLRKAFILSNCFMYLIFVLFIFLIAIIPPRQKSSPCFSGTISTSSNSATYKIKLAYWIFQLVVSAILSISFLIASFSLLRIVLQLRNSKRATMTTETKLKASSADKQIFIITAVAIVCVIFLIIRSSIFLWAAVTGNALNVIVFVLLECIPAILLLFYVHPFKCFREEGVSSSTRYTHNSHNSSVPRSWWDQSSEMSSGPISPQRVRSPNSKEGTKSTGKV